MRRIASREKSSIKKNRGRPSLSVLKKENEGVKGRQECRARRAGGIRGRATAKWDL